MKFLWFLALLLVVLWWWRRSQSTHTRQQASQQEPAKAPGPDVSPDAMVACKVCGLHVPRREAVIQGDRIYCCSQHLERDAAS